MFLGWTYPDLVVRLVTSGGLASFPQTLSLVHFTVSTNRSHAEARMVQDNEDYQNVDY